MTVRIGFVEIHLVGLEHSVVSLVTCPQGPHSHILRDFFGSMKDAGIFWGHKNNRDFFGYCIFHQHKSTITKAQFTACVVLQDISEIVIYLF